MPAPVDINDPFRALSDPTRRHILRLLAEGPLPVRLISDHFPGISRPAVSKHLRILREGGLVTEERSGRERYYKVEREVVRETSDWLRHVDKLAGAGATKPASAARTVRRSKRSARARDQAERKRQGERRSADVPSVSTPDPSEEGDWKAW